MVIIFYRTCAKRPNTRAGERVRLGEGFQNEGLAGEREGYREGFQGGRVHGQTCAMRTYTWADM